jgi:hypothetical protein
MTAGLVLGTSTMTSFSFTAFAIGMIPYLVFFNYWYSIGPGGSRFRSWMWIDVVGTTFFGIGSAWCAAVLKGVEEEEQAKAKSKK